MKGVFESIHPRAVVFCLLTAGFIGTVTTRAVDLMGSSVTGSLVYDTTPEENSVYTGNLFASAWPGLAAAHSGNTTVPIGDGLPEFAFYGLRLFRADFTSTGLSIFDDTSGIPFTLNSFGWTMLFEDPAFDGLTILKLTDTFPNGGLLVSLTGSSLSISWPGVEGGRSNAHDSATFEFESTNVPETSPTSVMGLAGVTAWLVGKIRRWRRLEVEILRD